MAQARRFVKELPPSPRGRYPRGPYPAHMKIIEKLKTRPGEWLPVRTYSSPQNASAFARKVREGRFIAFREGKFEAKAIGQVVYVRFLD